MSDNYDRRQKAMEYILKLDKKDFALMIRTKNIPFFVPAEDGDPDWELQLRDFSGHGLDWAWWNRSRLKTMDVEVFLDFVGDINEDDCDEFMSDNMVDT
jgi:hypothetical protein